MAKNILIINSESEITPLFPFFRELINNNCQLSFLSSGENEANDFADFKKLNLLKLNNAFFVTFLPLWFVFFFFVLIYYKYRKNINCVVCLDFKERILTAPTAKLLKIKTVWLELPGRNYKKLNKATAGLAKIFSFGLKFVVFTDFTLDNLKRMGVKNELIKKIPPGIKLKGQCHQENIFAKIAETKKTNNLKKFFTIGTAVDLENKQKIELLLQAAKKCLTVIPHLQLIVVGEGKERKNLAWLAKKIEIDSLVWFVGEQTFLKKWLENFDVYAVACENPNLKDLNLTLEATASGLPIISQDNMGFEEFVSLNQNGIIIESDSSEALAQGIIRLYKDKILRKNLGQNGRTMVDNSYTIDKMARSFLNIIEIT